eukprot:TRINITY_DN10047_c0_g1_i1.p1 TRINITY_DN10047_c0_g1~~TRINITY_DN10047_c0_g1_i1.p1  ORF type:complete len:166 (-),score=35.69 TRINITY_DN10047_c0_g1_i1:109-606(-)
MKGKSKPKKVPQHQKPLQSRKKFTNNSKNKPQPKAPPQDASREDMLELIHAKMMAEVLQTCPDFETEESTSLLLEGTPEAEELLYNTAINALNLSGVTPLPEDQIRTKMEELKKRENTQIQFANLKKALQIVNAQEEDDDQDEDFELTASLNDEILDDQDDDIED